MSKALAITTTPTAAPPAPRGIAWIDVATAAKRMNVDERTIRRRCGNEWAGRGLARLETPAGFRGKAEWTIREDADPMLGRIVGPDDLPADLTPYTDKQRNLAKFKKSVLDALDRHEASPECAALSKAKSDARFLSYLAGGVLVIRLSDGMEAPTDRTLRNWRRAYRKDGYLGLIDDRGTRQRKPVESDPFFEDVKRRWLDLRKPGVTRCWENACEAAKSAGWMTRSEKQTRRFIAKIPVAVVNHYRLGKKAFDDRSAAHITRDYSTINSNEIWVADHHQFDVMVKYRGKIVRPWLSCFMDMRSRKIVGWTVTAGSPNTETILAALDNGIGSHGIPVGVYTDNGKDYQSAALHGTTKHQRRKAKSEVDAGAVAGAFAFLGIGITNATPYNAKAKPVERFFGTLEDQFGKSQATYCGNRSSNRPENLVEKLDRGSAPELADFIAEFSAWLNGDYHNRPHTGDAMDGRTPAQVFDAHLVEKRMASEDVRQVMLFKASRPTKVTKNGVLVDGVRYGHAEFVQLFPHEGREVIVRVDRADINTAVVCELDGRFICKVTPNQTLPVKSTHEELRQAISENRRANKIVQEYHEARPKLHRDTASEMYAARAAEAERQRAANPPTAPIVSNVKTPMDDQLPLLEQALRGTGPRLAGSADVAGSIAPDGNSTDVAPRQKSDLQKIGERLEREREEREANEPVERDSFLYMAKLFRQRAVGDE